MSPKPKPLNHPFKPYKLPRLPEARVAGERGGESPRRRGSRDRDAGEASFPDAKPHGPWEAAFLFLPFQGSESQNLPFISKVPDHRGVQGR